MTKPRHLLLTRAILATLASIPFTIARTAELTRGPYLQQASSDSMVIVWRTAGETLPVLKIGKQPELLDTVVPSENILIRGSLDVNSATTGPALYQEPADEVDARESNHDPSTPANTFQYEARIQDLAPASTYYYAVYDDQDRLAGGDESYRFTTHPSPGSTADMRIWVVGDSGTGGENQAKVHQAMRAFADRTNRPVNHYLHVGDMAYSDGTDKEFQERFFQPYQETLRNTVCWPSMGNHEGHTSRGLSGFGPYYDAYVVPTRGEVGGAPSGTEAYYSFDIANVHFVCLDSYDVDRDPQGAMAQWLRADLDETQAKWLIAFWHHPPYTKGSHDSDRETALIEMRENFMPILESAGVDLTLSGHSHIYERSMLMDGAYVTPTVAKGVILDDGDGRMRGDGAYRKSAGLNPNEGSVSIVAGHGGTGLGREGTMPVMREIILEHGSVIIDIEDDTLTGIMLNKDGQTRDLFHLVKTGEVSPRRIENPWQPLHDPSLLTSIFIPFHSLTTQEMLADWSSVSGDIGALTIQTVGPGPTDKVLRAEQKEGPLICLYSPWKLKSLGLETMLRFQQTENQAVGLVFGYQDKDNYLVTEFDATLGEIRIQNYQDGQPTLLHRRDAEVVADRWIEVGIEVEGHVVEVKYEERGNKENELEFTFDLADELPESKLGFSLPAKAAVDFEWFEIQDES